jgi:hypothetical protein
MAWQLTSPEGHLARQDCTGVNGAVVVAGADVLLVSVVLWA